MGLITGPIIARLTHYKENPCHCGCADDDKNLKISRFCLDKPTKVRYNVTNARTNVLIWAE